MTHEIQDKFILAQDILKIQSASKIIYIVHDTIENLVY